MKEKIIIFGSGARALNTITIINKVNACEIVEVWDNNELKWGSRFCNIIVRKPHSNIKDIDKILICSVYYNEIFEQLKSGLHIPEDKIENHNYCWAHTKKQLIERYINSKDKEAVEIINYIKNHDLKYFNYDFVDKYSASDYKVLYDEKVNLYYVIRNNKKMYLSRAFNNIEKAQNYVKGICIEQDDKSPHKYIGGKYTINKGDIIIDAGAAEGFFTLDIIDTIDKAYLIEADELWVEALKYTFEDYKDKIVIVDKFLSDRDDENNISIDNLVKNNKIDFIKLDIEGYEARALQGATKTIECAKNVKVVACAYHYKHDSEEISNTLKGYNLEVEYSKGYMFFWLYDDEIEPLLRRGLVKAIKEKKG